MDNTEACVPEPVAMPGTEERCDLCRGPVGNRFGYTQNVCTCCLFATRNGDGQQQGPKLRPNSRKRLNPASLVAAHSTPLQHGTAVPVQGDTVWPAVAGSANATEWRNYSKEGGYGGSRAPQRQRSSGLATGDGNPNLQDVSQLILDAGKLRREQAQQRVPAVAGDTVKAATGNTALAAADAAAAALWDQPYSSLLSGPGFSYGADEDGIFETDVISLGSVDESDFPNDDLNAEDGELGESRVRFANPGNLNTASRGEAVHRGDTTAAVESFAAGARAGDVASGASATNCGTNGAVAVTAFRTQLTSLLAADDAQPGDSSGDGEHGGGGALDAVAALPPRAGSQESVGSAGTGEDPGTKSGMDDRNYDAPSSAGAGGDTLAGLAHIGLPGPATSPAAAAAAFAAAAFPAALAVPVAALEETDEEVSDAAAPYPAARYPAAPVPAAMPLPPLLPAEAYLGFVYQLVASVRSATQATANYYQNYCAGGHGQPAAAAPRPPHRYATGDATGGAPLPP